MKLSKYLPLVPSLVAVALNLSAPALAQESQLALPVGGGLQPVGGGGGFQPINGGGYDLGTNTASGSAEFTDNTGSKTGNINAAATATAPDELPITQNTSQFAQSSLNGSHTHNNAISLPGARTALMSAPNPASIVGLGGIVNGIEQTINSAVPGLGIPTGYAFGGTDVPIWSAATAVGADYGFTGNGYSIYTGGSANAVSIVGGLLQGKVPNYGGMLPPVGTGPVDTRIVDENEQGLPNYVWPKGYYPAEAGNNNFSINWGVENIDQAINGITGVATGLGNILSLF